MCQVQQRTACTLPTYTVLLPVSLIHKDTYEHHVCMCMLIHMVTCEHACMCILSHVYQHIHAQNLTCAHSQILTHAHTHRCTCTHLCVCQHMHTYIDTYSSCHTFIHVYACTYMLFLYATTSAEVTREQRRKGGAGSGMHNNRYLWVTRVWEPHSPPN